MPKKPVHTIVVITHPFYKHRSKEHTAKKLEALKRIINKKCGDPGTHFIVSWAGKKPKNRALMKLLKKIPASRLHEPKTPEPGSAGYSKANKRAYSKQYNYFIDDPLLTEHFKSLEFADEVRVDSWGDYIERCAANNLFNLVHFITKTKKNKISEINILGGSFFSAPTDNAIYGKRTPPKPAAYSKATKTLFDGIDLLLKKHSKKTRFAWPWDYTTKKRAG